MARHILRETLVLWVHHERRFHLDPIMCQHLAQTLLQRLQRQRAGEIVERDPIVAGCHDDSPSPHQVLVNGEPFSIAHRLRRNHHQHVYVSRHFLRQVNRSDLIVLAQVLGHRPPARQGFLYLAKHVLGWQAGRCPDTDHLEKTGRGTFERRFDRRTHIGLAQRTCWIQQLACVLDLQHHMQIVGLVREKGNCDRLQAVMIP